MKTPPTRRDFLTASTAATAAAVLLPSATVNAAEPVTKVVVWDERQPAQKKAYDNFLGNAIADHLKTVPGLSVKSVALDDPGQGLTDEVLDGCRVLVWWGHVRHAEVTPETGKKIVARVKAGTLSLISLHSAHWSTPFIAAMDERTREDFGRMITWHQKHGKTTVEFDEPRNRRSAPKRDSRLTPYADTRKFPNGDVSLSVHLPVCCFPSYREDGKPSHVRVLKPDHPIVKGVPADGFVIPHEEMYDEPFHVPEPDEVILEERWETGEWFRSGALWKVGLGHVFYFRPGHETYPTYRQEWPLKIVANAVHWLGTN